MAYGKFRNRKLVRAENEDYFSFIAFHLFYGGIIKTPDGAPAELLSGEIKSLTDPLWKTKAFFTNRAGRYVVEGVKPGRYQIEFFEGDWRKLEILVPEVADGLWKVSEQKVSKGGE
jgi:hypothetical protein